MQASVIHILLDDGIPRTINRRIKVKMIAQQHEAGLTVEELAAHYGITLADVYAALAYYHDNLDYFEAQGQELQPLIDNAKQYTVDLKAKIFQRMANKESNNDNPA